MNITNQDINTITEYGKNAKKHTNQQIDLVAKSIKDFGMVQPIVVDENSEIIIGHCRFAACKRLGFTEVPVLKAEHLSKEKVNALRLVDNKANESEWDMGLLEASIKEILDIDMSDFGFDLDEFIEAEEVVEVTPPPVDEKAPPKTKPGEIYQLGRHRLLCGDSTDLESVRSLMDGKQADMLLTDPPYNVAYQGGTKDALTIQNDDMDDVSFRAFLTDAFTTVDDILKPGGVFYVWHADSEGFNFRAACKAVNWKIRQCLIWNKNSLVMGRQDYHWKHEPCLYGWKDGAAHYFIDDRSQTTVIEDKGLEINKLKRNEAIALLQEIYSDKESTTIINEAKPAVNADHPTMKPIKLLARQVKNSTRLNEIVVDTFGGSGSTLITCEQLGRICYTMELDPKYCDVIIRRWEEHTGGKAVLVNE